MAINAPRAADPSVTTATEDSNVQRRNWTLTGSAFWRAKTAMARAKRVTRR